MMFRTKGVVSWERHKYIEGENPKEGINGGAGLVGKSVFTTWESTRE